MDSLGGKRALDTTFGNLVDIIIGGFIALVLFLFRGFLKYHVSGSDLAVKWAVVMAAAARGFSEGGLE